MCVVLRNPLQSVFYSLVYLKLQFKKSYAKGYVCVQIKHEIKNTYRPKRVAFAVDILGNIDDDARYLERIVFTDEATFHVNGVVNRHNCRIWGSEQPNEVFEYVRDSP